MRFAKYLAGFALALVASASHAQSTIQFDVTFNKLYQASGAFLPFLYDSTNDPMGLGSKSPAFTITGSVTLTAVASSTYLTNAGPNQITLNGSFSDSWPGVSPENSWLTHTYENATFDLFQTGGKFANNFTAPNPQPIFIGTGANGILSDHGPLTPCPFPRGLFPPYQNCASANPALAFGDGFTVYNGSSAVYPGLGNLGQHDLVSGTYTRSGNGATSNFDIGHDNGLDGFYFSGLLCTGDLSACGGNAIAPEGIVRIMMSSQTGNTWYVLEGTTTAPIPVPAAAWLVAPAVLAAGRFARRRKAA